MSWWSSLFPKPGRVMLPGDIRKRWERIMVCETCDRGGHGIKDRECAIHMLELEAGGVQCWRPRGIVLVWDEVEVGGWKRNKIKGWKDEAAKMARTIMAKQDGFILVWDEGEFEKFWGCDS